MTKRWQDRAALILDVWLLLSPWVLGYAGTMRAAVWNSVIVGPLIAILEPWVIAQIRRHRTATA